MGSSTLFYFALVSFLTTIYGQQTGVPIFRNVSAVNNRYLFENIPLGYTLGTIEAFDPDGSPLFYFLEGGGGEYFYIGPQNGTVTLKKLLDAELETEIRISLRVVDLQNEESTEQTKVFVNDVNDNPPEFADTAMSADIEESSGVGYVLPVNISVSDRDTSNSVIEVRCLGNTNRFAEACRAFRLETRTQSNKFWTGVLVVNEPLDYENRNSYAVQLLAFDGLFNVTTEVHVELEDVNDSPPRWISASSQVIFEEEALNTPIETVLAEDSDATNKNPIRYELMNATDSPFQIDPVSGVISNRERLDYDAIDFPKGVPFNVFIKARELLQLGGNRTELGSDPLTTSTIVITITVRDINDNSPTFDKNNYVATIPENIASNSFVPGLQMTITDIDSGTFNSFQLVPLNYTNVFTIVPPFDAASASATFLIQNGQDIDYESGIRQYVIQVEAREYSVPAPHTGTTTVTINVEDVNDVDPRFGQNTYNRSVSELATENTLIIDLNATDPEAGSFGTAGIRYSLFANIPAHFKIDERTGVIRVAACNPSESIGRAPCIDFESKRQYSLTVNAIDENGFGRRGSVNVNINVIDENDNVPAIETSYRRYILEGETVTINPLRIDASDPDTVGGPLSFSIEGDSTSLWRIDPQVDPASGQLYGNITARRPILYSDAPNATSGAFSFGVVVSDTRRSVSSPVTIIVRDINNNAPVFPTTEYIVQIPESTPGGTFITTVTATDADMPTTDNGVIDFSISRGSLGKFLPVNTRRVGNAFVADINTTVGATFNYDTQNRYEMTLVARDRGTPASRNGTTRLIVIITDTNNRNPTITPSFNSINVIENTPVGTSVYQVTARDPDATSDLRYSMIADTATDSSGRNVIASIYNFTNLFSINDRTGDVFVNAPLDRDLTARIRHDLRVQDVASPTPQIGTGILLIHILEFNDQAPQFNRTSFTLEIDEELNINSFVQNFNCVDEDDKIASYFLEQINPRRPQYLTFLPGSGAMIVNERIDYEQIESIQLRATCTDTGTPQLSNTTNIVVNIRNINDNTPIFFQQVYRTSIPEGYTGGLLNINVNASDADKGDYGVVRYALENNPAHPGWFSIDEITGQITVLPAAFFDRESQELVAFQVIAYDSPLDPSVRRNATVPVYIEVSDINDNCPVFSRSSYNGSAPESAAVNTDIIDIIASDRDEGVNAEIRFSIQPGSGTPPESVNLFEIGLYNGRVFVNGILRGRAGTYLFNVSATDGRCTVTVPVTVQVFESLNDAPEWVRPPSRDFVIYVLESQYEGMLVYNSKAEDPNRGNNGVVDYYFSVDGSDRVSHTPEFRINRVTGVIRAEIIYDRETRDNYFLTLMAVDRGNPAASSETTLTVVILDVDDNDPAFPVRNGTVPALELSLDENVNPSEPIGYCNATDADENQIYYRILAAQDNVRNYVSVDNRTCAIRVLQPVRFSDFPTLEFDILAYNLRNDDTVRRYRRETNPSIQHVIISVVDTNDNAPVFTEQRYFGCISIGAPYRQTILEVSARDVDAGDNARIVYSLSDETAFGISPNLGTIYNKVAFNSESTTREYSLSAFASDGRLRSQPAPVMLFVTSPSNIVRLKVNRPLTEVEPFSQQYVNTLIENSNNQIVFACVADVRNHIDDDGELSDTETDVLITAVRADRNNENPNGDYVIYPASDLVSLINDQRGQSNSADMAYRAIAVTDVEVEGDDDGWRLEEDAVLIILIICILLIVLALLLCCIGCYCIRNSKKKKERKIKAKRHTIVPLAHEPVETSFNPVYHNAEGDEYTTVQKARPMVSPISPVVIPAPQYLEPVPSQEPPTSLEPVQDPAVYRSEEPEPVFETIVLPDPEPIRDPEPYRQFEPEYEDRIETEVLDHPESFPPPPHVDVVQVDPDDDIDVEIQDIPGLSPSDIPVEVPTVTVVPANE